MKTFKINDEVILLKSLPFELSKGDTCVITNITTSIDNTCDKHTITYHIKKTKDSRYEFSVNEGDIMKKTNN